MQRESPTVNARPSTSIPLLIPHLQPLRSRLFLSQQGDVGAGCPGNLFEVHEQSPRHHFDHMPKRAQCNGPGQLGRIHKVHRTKRSRIGVRTTVDIGDRPIGHPRRILTRKPDGYRPTRQQAWVFDPQDGCSVRLLVKSQVPSPVANPIGLAPAINRHVQKQRAYEDAEELLESPFSVGWKVVLHAIRQVGGRRRFRRCRCWSSHCLRAPSNWYGRTGRGVCPRARRCVRQNSLAEPGANWQGAWPSDTGRRKPGQC